MYREQFGEVSHVTVALKAYRGKGASRCRLTRDSSREADRGIGSSQIRFQRHGGTFDQFFVESPVWKARTAYDLGWCLPFKSPFIGVPPMDADTRWSVSGESVCRSRLLLPSPYPASLVRTVEAKNPSHRLVSQTPLTGLLDCECLNPLEVRQRIIGLSERQSVTDGAKCNQAGTGGLAGHGDDADSAPAASGPPRETISHQVNGPGGNRLPWAVHLREPHCSSGPECPQTNRSPGLSLPGASSGRKDIQDWPAIIWGDREQQRPYARPLPICLPQPAYSALSRLTITTRDAVVKVERVFARCVRAHLRRTDGAHGARRAG